jgi:hypothetical protein
MTVSASTNLEAVGAPTELKNARAIPAIGWQEDIGTIKQRAKLLAKFMKDHEWLSSTHVTDFYIKDLWHKMPSDVSTHSGCLATIMHARFLLTYYHRFPSLCYCCCLSLVREFVHNQTVQY